MSTDSYIDDEPPRAQLTEAALRSSYDPFRDKDWDLDSAHESYIDDNCPTIWNFSGARDYNYIPTPVQPSRDRERDRERAIPRTVKEVSRPRSAPRPVEQHEARRHPSGVKPIPGGLLRKLFQYTENRRLDREEAAAEQKRKAIEAAAQADEGKRARAQKEQAAQAEKAAQEEKARAHRRRKSSRREARDEPRSKGKERASRSNRKEEPDEEGAKEEAPSTKTIPVIRIRGKNGEEAIVEVPPALVARSRAASERAKTKTAEPAAHVEYVADDSQHDQKTGKANEKGGKGSKGKKKKKHAHEDRDDAGAEVIQVDKGALMSGALPDEIRSHHSKVASEKADQAIDAGFGGLFGELPHSSHSRSRRSQARPDLAASKAASSHKSGQSAVPSRPASHQHTGHEKEASFVSFEEVGAGWYGEPSAQESKHSAPQSRSNKSFARDSKHSTPKSRSHKTSVRDQGDQFPAWDGPAQSGKSSHRSVAKTTSRHSTIHQTNEADWEGLSPGTQSKNSSARNSKEPFPAWDDPAVSFKGSQRSAAKSISRQSSAKYAADPDWKEMPPPTQSRTSNARPQQGDDWVGSLPVFEHEISPDDSISNITPRATTVSQQDQLREKSHVPESGRTHTSRRTRQSTYLTAPKTFSARSSHRATENRDEGSHRSNEHQSNDESSAHHSKPATDDWQELRAEELHFSKPQKSATFEEVGMGWHNGVSEKAGSRRETLASKLDQSSVRDWAEPAPFNESFGDLPTGAVVNGSKHSSKTFEHSFGGFGPHPKQTSERSQRIVSAHGTSQKSGDSRNSGNSRSHARSSHHRSPSNAQRESSDNKRSSEHRAPSTSHSRPRPATVYAGKGWITPHPLSHSEESPPDSKIVLPSEAFPQGATMTYEEWKELQERGLREHRNFSTTESSQGRTAKLKDGRYRFVGWNGQSSDGYRFEKEDTTSGTQRTASIQSNYHPPTVQSEHSSERTAGARSEKQSGFSDDYRSASERSRRSSARTLSQWSQRHSGSKSANDGSMSISAATRSSREREMEVMEEGRNVWSDMGEYQRSEGRHSERRSGRQGGSQTATSQLYFQRYPAAEDEEFSQQW